jgi:cytochrome c peroxidase
LRGARHSPQLSPPLRDSPDGSAKRLNLSEADKEALEAFLHTLTDSAVLNDPKFSDPFP